MQEVLGVLARDTMYLSIGPHETYLVAYRKRNEGHVPQVVSLWQRCLSVCMYLGEARRTLEGKGGGGYCTKIYFRGGRRQ